MPGSGGAGSSGAGSSGAGSSGSAPAAQAQGAGPDDPATIRQMLLSSPHDLSLLKERNPPLADALLSGSLGKKNNDNYIPLSHIY